jgi:ABC-type amino acid transport substrate-binding protein
MINVLLIITIFTISSLPSFANTNEDTGKKIIRLGVTQATIDSPQGKFSKAIFSKIFKHLDHELVIQILPPIRLAQQVAVGKVDGELIRMSSYGDDKKYLTRVEEAQFKFSVVVYSKQKLKKLGELTNQKDIKLGYRKGVKIVRNELLKISNERQLSSFTNPTQAFNLLSLGRIHAYIGVEAITDDQIKQFDKNMRNKIIKTEVLVRDSAHVFLGPKYSHLANSISRELKRLKSTGEAKNIHKQLKLK